MRIGIDFDNTLVSYELAFAAVGRGEGFLPPDFSGGKEAVKAWLLASGPDSSVKWETLQGLVYGRKIECAQLFEGAAEFFSHCKGLADAEIYIVSHKTVLAYHDPLKSNLRDAALRWMHARRFFDLDGFALKAENVFFEPTRDDKVRRIAALGCDVFVDDLPDVLGHSCMPVSCRKILFRGEPCGSLEGAKNWYDVRDAIFGCSAGRN